MRKATALGVAAALSLGAESVRAAETLDRQTCVDAYEAAQLAMRRAQLANARAQIRVCLEDACPGLLRTDCAQWLKDVDARQPTIVLEMKGERGETLSDVAVTMDGAPLAERIDGRGLEVDPGEHTLVFTPRGRAPVELKYVVKEGEKLQRVTAELPRRVEPPEAGDPAAKSTAKAPIPWTVYALGGLGLAAAGGFAYFGLSGLGKKDDLEACKPDCAHDDVVAVRTRFIAADVMLGVSLVSLAAAGIILFTRGNVQQAATLREPLLGGRF
jgi:hypothetical protein